MEVNKILQGDCLEVLKTLPENSVDSIVTDPPYELGFMNRAWDSTGIANNKDMWAECLRVLKPGGHLLAFSGTRTYHRMAVAIEDAGFEVRDMIEWVYSTGFPKSLNISKAMSKTYGIGLCTCATQEPMLSLNNENNSGQRDNLSTRDNDRPSVGKEVRITGIDHNEVASQIKHSDLSFQTKSNDRMLSVQEKCKTKGEGHQEVNKPILQSGVCKPIYEEEGYGNSTLRAGVESDTRKGQAKGQVVPELRNKWEKGAGSAPLGAVQNGRQKHNGESSSVMSELPSQGGSEKQSDAIADKNNCEIRKRLHQNGYLCSQCGNLRKDIGGSALKPAHEPICMARKPLAEKTVAENVLKLGCGGINIDESRIPTNEDQRRPSAGGENGLTGTSTFKIRERKVEEQIQHTGRFPANLILEDCEEVRECFPEANNKTGGSFTKTGELYGQKNNPQGFNDSGNASRFFKSIKTDELCTLCCLPVNDKRDTMSVCNNTNVNSAEKSLKTTQAITESIALENATGQVNKNLVQNVRSAGNLCDLCGTYIAQRLVEPKKVQDQELTLGELFMPERKKQILEKCLVSFVELMGNTDTIPTMENLNLLFGYVSNAIEEYTQKCEVIKNEGQNQWKSLVYRSKASKSERNKGCEGLEEKERIDYGGFHSEKGLIENNRNPENRKPTTNNHPTVKPIALMEYLIKMVTRAGGIVLDPFAGSGSTLVAAKQNGYQYIGIELTPEYIPIIEARLKSPISQKLF